MTPAIDLEIGPATPGSLRGQKQTFTATQPTDDQREQARELLHKWVLLHYVHEGKPYCIEGTVDSVTEAAGKLIIDLVLVISTTVHPL